MQSVRLLARRCLPLLALALALVTSCGGGRDDLPFAFSTTLNSAEEVPSTLSAGTGAGIVTIDPASNTMLASVVITGLTDTHAWIQDGSAGVNGPVIFSLDKETAGGAWTLRTGISDAQLSALRDGRYYFNVSSVAHPTGELRGQIFEQLPSSQQLQLLDQARQQSPLIEQQLQQIRRVEGGGDSGVGFGLFIRF